MHSKWQRRKTQHHQHRTATDLIIAATRPRANILERPSVCAVHLRPQANPEDGDAAWQRQRQPERAFECPGDDKLRLVGRNCVLAVSVSACRLLHPKLAASQRHFADHPSTRYGVSATPPPFPGSLGTGTLEPRRSLIICPVGDCPTNPRTDTE